MNRNIILGIVAVIAIAVGAYFYLGQQDSQSTQTANSESTSEVGEIDVSGVKEMSLGSDDAPVTIIEYASFTCPHCKTFHENVYGQLKADYIDTGKVKFVLREVYFDRYGLWAGMVARCNNAMRYFGIVDLLFVNQREWTDGDPGLIVENLKRLGKQTGMDDATLDACLQDSEKAQALTVAYQKNAQEHGITSTPSFVINGKTYSNMSYLEMKKIIDEGL